MNVNTIYLEEISNYFNYPSLTYLMQTSEQIEIDNDIFCVSTMYELFNNSQMAFAVWQYNNINQLDTNNIKYFPNKEMSYMYIEGLIK